MDPQQFDPFGSDYKSDPHRVFRDFRRTDPVHWGRSPSATSPGSWYLFSYEHVANALKDPRLIHDRASLLPPEVLASMPIPPGVSASFLRYSTMFIISTDPPRHTRLRGLVSKAFTPKVIEQFRLRVEAIAQELLREQLNKRDFDLIENFAGPLPLKVIAEMIGYPIADYDTFRALSNDLSATIESTTPDVLQKASAASDKLSSQLLEIIEQRRQDPRNDLITRLIDAEENGGHLSEDEIVATCMMLLVAGYETTVNLIGNGMYALLTNPTQLDALKSNRGLLKQTVEELLRFDAPGRIAVRWASEDIEFAGREIKRGDRVALVVASANRDEAVFENPDSLHIKRDASKHLGFGMGIHYCLGAALARMEAETAFATLLDWAPNLRLATRDVEWQKRVSIRGLTALPVSV